MGLAFDNCDEFTNTPSGADSLHDTMCIFYQNVGSSTMLVEPLRFTTETEESNHILDRSKQKT